MNILTCRLSLVSMVSRSYLSGSLFDLVGLGIGFLFRPHGRALGLSAAKKAITDEVGLVHASRGSAHHAASRPHARTGQLELPSAVQTLENQGIYLDLSPVPYSSGGFFFSCVYFFLIVLKEPLLPRLQIFRVQS